MSFNFTGTTRRRNINLGNRSLVGKNRVSFLENADRERRRREHYRTEVRASITLQATIRAYIDLNRARKSLSEFWTGNVVVFRFFFPCEVTRQTAQKSLEQLDTLDSLIRLQDDTDLVKLANCLISSIEGLKRARNGHDTYDGLICRALSSLDQIVDRLDDNVRGPNFSSLLDSLFELQDVSPLIYKAIFRYGAYRGSSNTVLSILSSERGSHFVGRVLSEEQDAEVVDPFLRAQMAGFVKNGELEFGQLVIHEKIIYLGNLCRIFFFQGEAHYSGLIDDVCVSFWALLLKGIDCGVVFSSNGDGEESSQMDIDFDSTKQSYSSDVSIPGDFYRSISDLFISSFPRLVLRHCGDQNLPLFTSFLYSLLQFIAPHSSRSKNATNSELQNSLVIELIVTSASFDMLNRLFATIESGQPYISLLDGQRSSSFFMTALQAPMKSWWMALYVFEETYSYVLSVSHDSDLFAKGRLSKANYVSFVKFLKHLVVLAVLEFRKFRKQQDDLPLLGYFKNTVLLSLKLLRQIYMRNLRLNLFEADFWYLEEDFSVKSVLPLLQQVEDDMGFRIPTPLFGNDLSVSSSSLSSSQLGSVLVLAYIPYMIPFEQRASLFHALIDLDRTRMGGWFAAKTQGTVSRQNILFDAFEQFGSLPGEQFKRPISVEFINRFGEREAGIDGGGLTKELLTSLVTSAFIPSKENASQNGGFRFFDTTTDSQLFPSADYFLELKYAQLHPEQTEYSAESRDFTLQMLRFLGMVVGKCLYENVLIDVSFAPFFLNRWSTAQGRRNFMGAAQTVEESQRYRNSFDDLQSFDGELYQSLVKLLKFSKEELESLDITFTVTERLGKSHNVTLDLLPGGSHLHVTSENKLQYVYCVAKYKLDQRIGVQTAYFLDGLFQVIRPHWLSLFNPYELQTLISGGEKEIDVDDLKRNIVLGGYITSDSTVKYLFEILREFSPEQKGKFVKFVTSSSKQPLLGFKELNPKFGIRNSGNDPERLPTASTCVNLLKLPDYRDKELLRRKLLYSINAEAGFDLS